MNHYINVLSYFDKFTLKMPWKARFGFGILETLRVLCPNMAVKEFLGLDPTDVLTPLPSPTTPHPESFLHPAFVHTDVWML
jgi:hypothetical protein